MQEAIGSSKSSARDEAALDKGQWGAEFIFSVNIYIYVYIFYTTLTAATTWQLFNLCNKRHSYGLQIAAGIWLLLDASNNFETSKIQLKKQMHKIFSLKGILAKV